MHCYSVNYPPHALVLALELSSSACLESCSVQRFPASVAGNSVIVRLVCCAGAIISPDTSEQWGLQIHIDKQAVADELKLRNATVTF